MPIVALDDVELAYQVDGSGPPLLCLSGSGGGRLSPPELHGRFTVASYDHREQRESSSLGRPSTMADYAADAAGLIDALGWERAHVVGISFGGMVAQHLALDHPERVDRLVLCCTSPGGSHASADFGSISPDEAARLIDTRGAAMPELGAIDPPPPALLAARAGHDVVDRLDAVAAPTLVCAGRYDGIAPVANSQLLADRIPDARLEVFEGGHGFMMQDARTWPVVAEFLDG